MNTAGHLGFHLRRLSKNLRAQAASINTYVPDNIHIYLIRTFSAWSAGPCHLTTGPSCRREPFITVSLHPSDALPTAQLPTHGKFAIRNEKIITS